MTVAAPRESHAEPAPALRVASNLILGGVGVAGLLLLAYAANRFRSFTEPRALFWYAVAMLVVASAVAASRLRPATRVGIALLIAMSGLGLAVAEGALITLAWRRRVVLERAVAAYTGRPFDSRSLREVVRDLRADGGAAVPSVVPKVLIGFTGADADPRFRFHAAFFPLAGVSRRPTVQLCNEDGHYPVFESDRSGFQNPDRLWDSLPATLLLVGDSFTHGYCVDDDSTIAARLRDRWPRVLNLGSGGSGPLSELAALTEFGLAAHPAVVVWFYFENDLSDLATERGQPTLARYLEPGFTQGLRGRQAEVDRTLESWVDAAYGSGGAGRDEPGGDFWSAATLGSLRRLVRTTLSRTAEPPADVLGELPHLVAVLRAARDRVEAQGGRVLFVHLPRWERFFGTEMQGHPDARPDVLRAVGALGIPMLDLTEPMLSVSDRATLFGRGGIAPAHYSAAGYAFIASRVEAALDSLHLVPAVR